MVHALLGNLHEAGAGDCGDYSGSQCAVGRAANKGNRILLQGAAMNLTMIGAIAAAVIIGALSLAVKVQSSRLESCKAEYAAFVAETKRLGEAAKSAADAEKKRLSDNLAKTEKSYAKARSDLATANRQLRDASTSRSYVPAVPADTKRPDLACFDRAELAESIKRLVAGMADIASAGDEATLNLNSGKEWAQGLKP